jgi:hypothetical protein
MRRLLAILLMLILPLQFAWSAAASLDGHLGNEGSAAGFHHHDHDDHGHHHDAGTDGHDGDAASGVAQEHHDDGQHDDHYHPVFSMLVLGLQPDLTEVLPHAPPTRPPSTFTSHIPLLFDWPPSVLL